jgi:hypothetical protein
LCAYGRAPLPTILQALAASVPARGSCATPTCAVLNHPRLAPPNWRSPTLAGCTDGHGIRHRGARRRAGVATCGSAFLPLTEVTTTPTLPLAPPTKRYRPVGFCIYCGSKKEPLSDEHPFPFGLGGAILLPKASCAECQLETTKIEDLVLRRILKGFRTQHGLPSRRKPPSTLPLWLMLPDRRAESVDIAVSEHPGSLTLPVFEPPGIIDGKPMERELKISVHAIIRNPSRLPSLIHRHGGPPRPGTRTR